MSYTLLDTGLGRLGLVGSTAGLRRIVLPQPSQEALLQLIMEGLPGAIADPSPFSDLPQRLRRYLRGEPISFDDELDLTHATPFRRAVWQVTRSIPYGETQSYGWIAQQIAKPKALRAVGQALAKNPFPIVVPCHRVVGKDGNLRGFGSSLEMRKRLLDLEASSQH
jgi:methylated-DNA-[protein]-cysteine S-methyltransferase